jgi:hypothetical protein
LRRFSCAREQLASAVLLHPVINTSSTDQHQQGEFVARQKNQSDPALRLWASGDATNVRS